MTTNLSNIVIQAVLVRSDLRVSHPHNLQEHNNSSEQYIYIYVYIYIYDL